mgnify:CR=1 FL=1
MPKDDSPREKMASIMFPIIRPEKMASFLCQWEHWFVLTNKTADKRFPGKLKCKLITYLKFQLTIIIFISCIGVGNSAIIVGVCG